MGLGCSLVEGDYVAAAAGPVSSDGTAGPLSAPDGESIYNHLTSETGMKISDDAF
jgi:hypothetical protein